MGDFVRGWRRKAGCVTLVMAAIVAWLWMRSDVGDAVAFQWNERFEIIAITDGQLFWSSRLAPYTGPHFKYQSPFPATFMEIIFEVSRERPDLEIRSWQLPFWLLAPVLTFVSALLILWPVKRREKSTIAASKLQTDPAPM